MLFRGSKIKLSYESDGKLVKDQIMILAQTFDKDYIFQLINISGYYAGVIEAYIKIEGTDGGSISIDLLKKELERNFLGINWNEFEIVEKG